jgi:hypothetical protein
MGDKSPKNKKKQMRRIMEKKTLANKNAQTDGVPKPE